MCGAFGQRGKVNGVATKGIALGGKARNKELDIFIQQIKRGKIYPAKGYSNRRVGGKKSPDGKRA